MSQLDFGVFVTPNADAVALARRAEELGFDLVTFQDHPYQPAHLDTWTLMAWVAGQTERIRIAPNVINLPLRQPAVLARAAASLDLLSNGRLELGLGAGAFWDAIAAMGGPRRAPRESLAALAEAIEVVRAMVDGGTRQPVRLRGDHYIVDGAQPGPLPAHHLPIWVGGRKPRMLRLIGEKADGWLVSQPYLGPGELAAGNKVIDEAAEAAGRDPADIRRLLNIAPFAGPSSQWVDDLRRLVTEEHVDALILMTDSVGELERFAGEVVPALRSSAPRSSGVSRSSTVRAKRRPGIAYDDLPPSLVEGAVEPGDIAYARVRSNYLRGGSPGLVLRPRSTEEVIEALAFARRHPTLPLGVRSGGHGVSGRSTNDGGIVVDLGRLNAIEIVDEATRRVRVGPGARWKQVARALEPHGWALSSGDYGGVGVGGLATAGGIGLLGRLHGLTIDHLRAVELILADGSVARASTEENPDLFWAVRGAGANFGIVTSFEFEVDAVPDVGWAQLHLDASDIPGFLRRFGQAAAGAPRDTTAFLVMGPPRRGRPAVATVFAMVANDEPETVIDRLQPFAAIAPLHDHQIVITPYADVMNMFPDGAHEAEGEPFARSAFVREITPAFASGVAALLRTGVVYFFQLRTVGGAISDVDSDATAYPHRDANFQVTALGVDRRALDVLWDGLSEHFDGLYLSFETDLRPERLLDAFGSHGLARLRELKRRYDPDNVFRDNFNIKDPS